MVIHPVADLDAALRFYEEGLGLRVKFRDGDRFCALDAGEITIALAAGEERVADTTAVSYKVEDVDVAVKQLEASGAEVVQPVAEGPHERRAVLRDPAKNLLIVYSSKSKPSKSE